MINIRTLATRVLPWILATRILFSGFADADPARGWEYTYPENLPQEKHNYSVVVKGEGYNARRVSNEDIKRWAWHITKDGEVIGDTRDEEKLYACAAMTAEVAYLIDTHGRGDLDESLSDVFNNRADEFETLLLANQGLNFFNLVYKAASHTGGFLLGSKIGGVDVVPSAIKSELVSGLTAELRENLEEKLSSVLEDRTYSAPELSQIILDSFEETNEATVIESIKSLRYCASQVEQPRQAWELNDAYEFLDSYANGNWNGMAVLKYWANIHEQRSEWNSLLSSFLENFIEGGTGINPRTVLGNSDFWDNFFGLNHASIATLEEEAKIQYLLFKGIEEKYDFRMANGVAGIYLKELIENSPKMVASVYSQIINEYDENKGYNEDRIEIFVEYNDGTNERLTFNPGPDHFPDLSPDRARVVFCSKRGPDEYSAFNRGELYVLDLETGKERRITRNDRMEHAPRWINNREIKFESGESYIVDYKTLQVRLAN